MPRHVVLPADLYLTPEGAMTREEAEFAFVENQTVESLIEVLRHLPPKFEVLFCESESGCMRALSPPYEGDDDEIVWFDLGRGATDG